jgi:prepilin-type N-terminal cleavage/methylation domain-containing protein
MTFSESSVTCARRKHAFTLIEIMLALGIFTMLIAALYATWMLVIRATIVGKTTAAHRQRERIAVRSIEDSLICIQSHQASINYYLFNIQNGDQPYLSFTAYLPDNFPRSSEFSGQTPDGIPMAYQVRRLTFFLKPEQNSSGIKDLVLQQSPILMPMPPAEQNNPLVLAQNVTAFTIECWDTNTAEWDTEWEATNMLPPLVRVTLGFADAKGGGSQLITREISFPASTMPSQVQSPNYNNGSGGGMQNFMNGNGGNSPPSGAPGNFSSPYGPQSVSIQNGTGPVNLGPPDLPTTSSQLQ